MRKILAGILSLTMAATLAGCGAGDNVGTETPETTAAVTVETTITEGIAEESEAEETTEIDVPVVEETETEASISVTDEIIPPNADMLYEMFTLRVSDRKLDNGKDFLGIASPSGSASAFYEDIDNDNEKEFCFIWDTAHGSTMYVCEFLNGAWEPVDVLLIAPNYTYLQAAEQGTQLFTVVGIRAAEGLESYTYDGTEEYFVLFDETEIEDEEDYYNGDGYYRAIENALAEYDGLQPLYDLPHAQTAKFYEIAFMDDDNMNGDRESAQAALNEFADDVAAMFEGTLETKPAAAENINGPVEEFVTIAGTQHSTLEKELNIEFPWGEEATNEDVAALAKMTNLEKLSITGGYGISEAFSELTNLKELTLFQAVGDLTFLKELPNLTKLGISHCSISDLSPLASLPNLTELSLENYSEADLTPVYGLMSLTALEFYHEDAVDASKLAGLTNLKSLSVGMGGMTNVDSLAQLTDLESITISDMFNVSDDDIANLKQAMPSCKIN